MEDKESALVTAIADMHDDEALAMVGDFIGAGTPPLRILDMSRQAMDIVSKRYEDGEYFLPELMVVGDLMVQIADKVKPLLARAAAKDGQAAPATVLIGTVAGDMHDIGKNIVALMLEVNGFKVVDLGIDVPSRTFVDAIRQHQPAVVGLSGLLTIAYDAMRDTVAAIRQAGVRDQVKIMIGGGQVDDAIRDYIGADAYGANAMGAVTLCQGWLGRSA